MRQKTLIILKPDTYQRRLVGELISRIERKGLKLAGMKLMRISEDLAKKHYSVHVGKHFFDDLLSYIVSGPVVVMVVEGTEAISVMRKLVGATCGFKAEPGSIRGDYSISMRYNMVHASDSQESADYEIGNFFSDDDLVDTSDLCIDSWIEGGE